MFLREIFLSETSNEDRAIVSLAAAVSKMIRQEYPHGSSIDGESHDLGKISDHLNTPLEALGNISIVLSPEEDLKGEGSAYKADDVVDGLWEPETETIFVSDRILQKADQSLLRILTHELRHALDDYKSDFRAGKSKRYDTPKKKEFRGADKHDLGDVGYLASPAEINARFAEVLSLVVMSIQKHMREIPDLGQAKKQVYADLDRFMKAKKVSTLFPEREKSKDYKRLMSRAADFIEKEFQYKSQQGK